MKYRLHENFNVYGINDGDLSWITSPLSGCPFGSDLEYGIEWPFTSMPATTVTVPCGQGKTGAFKSDNLKMRRDSSNAVILNICRILLR